MRLTFLIRSVIVAACLAVAVAAGWWVGRYQAFKAQQISQYNAASISALSVLSRLRTLQSEGVPKGSPLWIDATRELDLAVFEMKILQEQMGLGVLNGFPPPIQMVLATNPQRVSRYTPDELTVLAKRLGVELDSSSPFGATD